MTDAVIRWDRCGRTHKSWGAVAKCLWPRTHIWGANGPFATLAPCGSLTIELHPDLLSAQSVMGAIEGHCGSQCSPRRHQLIQMKTRAKAPQGVVMPPWCGQCDGAPLAQRWVEMPTIPGEEDFAPRVARCPRCNPQYKR